MHLVLYQQIWQYCPINKSFYGINKFIHYLHPDKRPGSHREETFHKKNTHMTINWLAILVAAIVPTIIGFIWYNPKVFGTAWMKASGMTEEKIKGGNMPVIFGLSFVFAFMLSFSMTELTIHQNNLPGLFMDGPNRPAADSEEGLFLKNFFEKYGDRHRTFTHGMVHGIIAVLFFGLPLLATNALFERKGFKYIIVNVGYWLVTVGIMGGIVCGWP